MTLLGLAAESGAQVFYVETSLTVNSWTTMESTSYNTTGSKAIVFTTGASGPFTLDVIDTVMRVNGGTLGDDYTVKLDLRNVTVGGLPGSTLYATDTGLFETTDIANSPQSVVFDAADLTNISQYSLQPSTRYAISLYNARVSGAPTTTSALSLARNSTTGAGSTVTYTSGFSGAGFVSNGSAYAGSLQISLGQAAVPEPSTYATVAASALVAFGVWRRTRTPRRSASV